MDMINPLAFCHAFANLMEHIMTLFVMKLFNQIIFPGRTCEGLRDIKSSYRNFILKTPLWDFGPFPRSASRVFDVTGTRLWRRYREAAYLAICVIMEVFASP
jgi:hypothetical protein